MASDSELKVHRDWIGLLQPVGLVVSPPALVTAQAFPDRNILEEQQQLASLLTPSDASTPDTLGRTPPGVASIRSEPLLPLRFAELATTLLKWKREKLLGAPDTPPLPESLAVVLPELGETLRPTYAVPALSEDLTLKENPSPYMLLVQELSDGTPLDALPPDETARWRASAQTRFERLLRETGVNIGILCNGRALRLVYAPRGETSGHVTWPIHRLITAMDRDMLSALCMLLGRARLFTLPREQRLPHILRESRKYQSVVSTRLANQVLEALHELLRGFQGANEVTRGALLDATVREAPDQLYGGLLAVLLRLVFVLYAEERGLLSSSVTYVRSYSLSGLFDRLRMDAGRFPDTMDRRFGAWSRLLVLFRMLHDGARRGDLKLPPRYGHLFDPDGWPFLEGRAAGVRRTLGEVVSIPRVSDGTVYRVLEKLLLLDGDRLSYRALDVEQIGSVYENMMGFRLERALETSIGLGKHHVVVGLESLLAMNAAAREKYLKDVAGVEVSGKALETLKKASSIEALVEGLSRRISPLTPRPIPPEGLYLQPTNERRRSGSHYTPRELTEPIVRTTLRPLLEDLGPSPTPQQILALKVCDPAMGSGAFLVETCRQLAEQLVRAYDRYGRPSAAKADDDILLYAQRLVAQHCLYGVDKNPLAVDLGKLSLWLATLAQDHAFTFLDHSLRHGDSLVGLSREQISSFHWSPQKQVPLLRVRTHQAIEEALALRAQIQALANSDDVKRKQALLREANEAIAQARMVGDAVVASFFSEEKPKARDEARALWESKVLAWLTKGHEPPQDLRALVDDLRTGEKPVPCFHWALEFPEVFAEGRAGFDAMVGNPPYSGKNSIIGASRDSFIPWIKTQHSAPSIAPSVASADLVAHFFRRAFLLIRDSGNLGFVATNTAYQGDTRRTGIGWICCNGGKIFSAQRRLRWPGRAAVVVCIVHIHKGISNRLNCTLNDKIVLHISPFLLPVLHDVEPSSLGECRGMAFKGCELGSLGFIVPIAVENELSHALRPDGSSLIKEYVGGEDLNDPPGTKSRRFVFDVDGLEKEHIPDLAWKLLQSSLLDDLKKRGIASESNRWWCFRRPSEEMRRTFLSAKQVIATARVSTIFAFTLFSQEKIPNEKVVLFNMYDFASFCLLQSRVHEEWTRAISGSMKDDLQYAATDCFETFPPPIPWKAAWKHKSLAINGSTYFQFREDVMLLHNDGLRGIYNRFHDPEKSDSDILKLRALHDAMDRAVLDAYGWTDIQPRCEFILDYEEEGDDSESGGNRRKKKPWRYRWPDDLRDEVLARLLELNAERAREEKAAQTVGKQMSAPGSKKRPTVGSSRKSTTPAGQGTLFGGEET